MTNEMIMMIQYQKISYNFFKNNYKTWELWANWIPLGNYISIQHNSKIYFLNIRLLLLLFIKLHVNVQILYSCFICM